jgi:hypothetical protein
MLGRALTIQAHRKLELSATGDPLVILSLAQISFLRIPYLRQHYEDGTMMKLYCAEIQRSVLFVYKWVKKRREQKTFSPL